MINLFVKYWEWLFDLPWYSKYPQIVGDVLLLIIILIFILGVIICLPSNITWAVLMKPEEMPKEAPDLKLKHDDWWPGLRWVPRRLTAFIRGPSAKDWYPVQLLGNNTRILRSADKWKPVKNKITGKPITQCDVPELGTWSFSWPLHLAVYFKSKWKWLDKLLLALGFRCNYYGKHWNYPRFVCRKNLDAQ